MSDPILGSGSCAVTGSCRSGGLGRGSCSGKLSQSSETYQVGTLQQFDAGSEAREALSLFIKLSGHPSQDRNRGVMAQVSRARSAPRASRPREYEAARCPCRGRVPSAISPPASQRRLGATAGPESWNSTPALADRRRSRSWSAVLARRWRRSSEDGTYATSLVPSTCT